jgi:hypothetical protein
MVRHNWVNTQLEQANIEESEENQEVATESDSGGMI